MIAVGIISGRDRIRIIVNIGNTNLMVVIRNRIFIKIIN